MTEGAVATEAWSLFQYFITLTEKTDSLLLRWPAPWRHFKARFVIAWALLREGFILSGRGGSWVEQWHRSGKVGRDPIYSGEGEQRKGRLGMGIGQKSDQAGRDVGSGW